MICSFCLKEKKTVKRYMFDGLCADCTDLALLNSHIAEIAKKNNKRLLNGEIPKYCYFSDTLNQILDCDSNNIWINNDIK